MDIVVLKFRGLEGTTACFKVLQQALTGARERTAVYGVKEVHFEHEVPGNREIHRTNNVTLAYLGSLARNDPALLELALSDLRTIKAESPQYPVVAILDDLGPEADARLRREGFEAIASSELSDEKRVRAFVENKVIELRLGISPPLLPENLGLAADDPNVLQAIKYEFAGATPPAELWAGTPAKARRNLLITFTYLARACRRLATRPVEGRLSATAFVLTHRAPSLVRSFARRGATVFRFGQRELRVSLGGIHTGDMEATARVSDWPGSFVVIDDVAMIRGIVATPEKVVRGQATTSPQAFSRLLGRHPEVGFLVPGDRTVRVYSGEREVLRHDGFEWRTNNREAVAHAFERTCAEVGVPARTATSVFDAALLLAEQKRGCFVILGDARATKRLARHSVPLDPRLSVALEARAVSGASPLVISALAEQDGALIVDPRGAILGFGRLVRTRERPKDDVAHGTKHATAAQLSREAHSLVTLVVSQDGPASVYFRGELVARTQF